MYLLFLFTPTLVVTTEILFKASKVEVFIPGWVQYATIIFSLISCTCIVLMSKCRVLKKVLIIACTIVMIFLEIYVGNNNYCSRRSFRYSIKSSARGLFCVFVRHRTDLGCSIGGFL